MLNFVAVNGASVGGGTVDSAVICVVSVVVEGIGFNGSIVVDSMSITVVDFVVCCVVVVSFVFRSKLEVVIIAIVDDEWISTSVVSVVNAFVMVMVLIASVTSIVTFDGSPMVVVVVVVVFVVDSVSLLTRRPFPLKALREELESVTNSTDESVDPSEQ